MIKNHIRRLEVLVRRLAAELRGTTSPPTRRLQTVQDIIDLLEEQIAALGYLASLARQTIETGDLAALLEALEVREKLENRD